MYICTYSYSLGIPIHRQFARLLVYIRRYTSTYAHTHIYLYSICIYTFFLWLEQGERRYNLHCDPENFNPNIWWHIHAI